jgi:hypothetical protein
MLDKIRSLATSSADVAQSPGRGLLAEWCAAIDAQLAELRQLFEEKIREDAGRGDLFEKLFRDLANDRDDFLFINVTRRMLEDLIRLFDRVDRLVEEQDLTVVLDYLRKREVNSHQRGRAVALADASAVGN